MDELKKRTRKLGAQRWRTKGVHLVQTHSRAAVSDAVRPREIDGATRPNTNGGARGAAGIGGATSTRANSIRGIGVVAGGASGRSGACSISQPQYVAQQQASSVVTTTGAGCPHVSANGEPVAADGASSMNSEMRQSRCRTEKSVYGQTNAM